MGDHRSRATPPRPPRRRWRPWLAVLVGALALALGVAACGGGDQPSGVASLGDRATTTSAGGSQERRVAFARCMPQHGVNLPDPNPNQTDWGPEPEGPKPAGWDAAWQACRRLLPASDLPNNAPPSPQELGQLRAFAVCMRAHDIDMSDPDPKTGDMTTGHVTRDQEQNDPAYKAAEAACRDKLPAQERQPRK
jgi:hypothetical protein